MLLQVAGARDHALCGLCQLAGAQGAVLQLSDADGHVEPFADQLHIAVVQHHVHCDVREFLEEIAQHRAQVVHTEIRRHRNPQQTRGITLHRADQRIRLAGIIEHPQGAVVIGQTDLCRAHPASCPVQKARTQTGLKRRHMLGNGGFRNPHLAGCVRKSTLVHHGGEGFHFGQAIHDSYLFHFAPAGSRNPPGIAQNARDPVSLRHRRAA